MRRNGYSTALKNYLENLERPRRLYRIELTNYKDPPPVEHQIGVEALRGGATVLMVATLERYLQEAFEEFVTLLASRANKTDHTNLPTALVEFNDFNFFDWLIRDSRLGRAVKAAELKRVASLVSNNLFVPEAFSRTRSNPGSDTIKRLFRDFGIADVFGKIENRFGQYFRKPFSKGYVETTLTLIVSRINEVAHQGYSLSIGRADLVLWLQFLSSFGRSADNVLRDHTLTLISNL